MPRDPPPSRAEALTPTGAPEALEWRLQPFERCPAILRLQGLKPSLQPGAPEALEWRLQPFERCPATLLPQGLKPSGSSVGGLCEAALDTRTALNVQIPASKRPAKGGVRELTVIRRHFPDRLSISPFDFAILRLFAFVSLQLPSVPLRSDSPSLTPRRTLAARVPPRRGDPGF